MSVYDDISVLIDDEAAEIDGLRTEAREEHQRLLDEAQAAYSAAVKVADAWFDAALQPLVLRGQALISLREQVKSLAAAAAAPVPDPQAGPSASWPPPSESEPPSSSSSPETDDSTPPTDQAAAPASVEAIPAEQVDFVTATPDTPVAVTLDTGEVKVVTVEDIMAAADNDIATADLTPDQQVIRNSDLP